MNIPNDPKGAAGALKTPLGLIPPHAMEQTAWAHKLGAEKYGPFNWRSTGVCASTYVNAMMRHLNAWRDGEDLDPESGISHLAHIACSCNILMDADYCGTLMDDRNITPQNVDKQEIYPDDFLDEVFNAFYADSDKYEDLDVGDVIEQGDEYYDTYECEWVKSEYIGMPIPNTKLHYRRPIKQPGCEEESYATPECKCGRILIDHFILGTICEDCDLQWQDPY